MALFKTITQGGQVHIHQLRMLKQIITVGSVVALLSGCGYFVWNMNYISDHKWKIFSQILWARFMIATTHEKQHADLIQLYHPPKGAPYQRKCLHIVKDPLLKHTTKQMEQKLKQVGVESLKFALFAFLGVMGFWFFFGRAHQRAQHQRGNTLVHWKILASLIKKRRASSDLTLFLNPRRKLPLLKNKETSHILITGTTGSGKTNTFHILIPQIRRRQDKAIVVDTTGTYLSRYYDEKTDFILNPYDLFSQSWHPWSDCHMDFHYDTLAESFIPERNAKDPFWDNASRILFKTALKQYATFHSRDISHLTNFLLSATSQEFEEFFKGTDAATFASQENEKTTQSIRSVLASQIESLKQLKSTQNDFSIRSWVHDDNQKGWLFIVSQPDQRQSLMPLISAWMDIAINALMTLAENPKRRIWFVIDELASLQKLPSLSLGLAETRKYGGCFLVGFQSKPQLEDVYGKNSADAMLDLFNTKLFFRCTEPSTQSWISKVLGDKEEKEPQENISFGAHSMRDGVSLTQHTRQKPLVMPAEFSQLHDLEAYIKLPGNYPCAKVQMAYQKMSSSLEIKKLTSCIPKTTNKIMSLPDLPSTSFEKEDLI